MLYDDPVTGLHRADREADSDDGCQCDDRDDDGREVHICRGGLLDLLGLLGRRLLLDRLLKALLRRRLGAGVKGLTLAEQEALR